MGSERTCADEIIDDHNVLSTGFSFLDGDDAGISIADLGADDGFKAGKELAESLVGSFVGEGNGGLGEIGNLSLESSQTFDELRDRGRDHGQDAAVSFEVQSSKWAQRRGQRTEGERGAGRRANVSSK